MLESSGRGKPKLGESFGFLGSQVIAVIEPY